STARRSRRLPQSPPAPRGPAPPTRRGGGGTSALLPHVQERPPGGPPPPNRPPRSRSRGSFFGTDARIQVAVEQIHQQVDSHERQRQHEHARLNDRVVAHEDRLHRQ